MERPLAERPSADAPLAPHSPTTLSAGAADTPLDAATIEQVVVGGDLARLTPAQRVSYYQSVCQSLGLSALTRPFEYIRLNDKLTLYARRDATDQLRRLHKISVEIVAREQQGDIYVVTARATTPDGRTDEAIGAVSLSGQSGVNLANCLMRAETKAKRRVTLSVCGLGFLDESEVDTVRVARRVKVSESGDVLDAEAREHMGATSSHPQPGENSTHARARLMRRWKALQDQADRLGIQYEPLPDGADEDTIIAFGTRLRAEVDRTLAGRPTSADHRAA